MMSVRAAVRTLGLAALAIGLLWPVSGSAATWRVGLQAGHWRSNELPDELKSLRSSTGTAAGGYREYQVNLDMAQRTAAYLRAAGVLVDLLPATVPPGYRADAFVALHADGSTNQRMSGYKASGQWREWEASTALVDALKAEYGAASGLSWDGDHISSGMRGYYALSSRRFDHTVSIYTPGVILEMGYLTNPGDRQLMTQQADRLARGVANGILRFLRSKPTTGWPAPPPLPDLRATVIATTANLRTGPGTNYPVVRTMRGGRSFLIAGQRGDWLRLFSYRSSTARWIHRDLVQIERLSDEPPQDGSSTASP